MFFIPLESYINRVIDTSRIWVVLSDGKRIPCRNIKITTEGIYILTGLDENSRDINTLVDHTKVAEIVG